MIADSARKLAGQTLIAGFSGQELPAELSEAARRGEIGGFVLFRRNLVEPEQIAELTSRLIAACTAAEAPPWIAVDQEGGRVQRLGPPVLQLPPMRALGDEDDVALTEQAGRVLGRQLAALGFNLDFAPVLDVDTHAESPIIGDRSFGRDPLRVARHGAAFARGLEAAGVAACGKHFPGHGDAALDSHLALPRVSHDRERLDAVELAPFRTLAPEFTSIMTAHIVFDAIDAERPATLSRAALLQLLRGELGFSGVIFSDDLEMKAIADHQDAAEAACEAIAAGCDAILVCSRPDLCLAARDALAQRATREPAFAARLRDAAERNLGARRRHAVVPEASERVRARLAALRDLALEERLSHARA
jgi:beta-N-acetylhexosaminidase